MFTQTLKQHRTWLASATLLLTLAGVFVARTAFARIVLNTIDPVGILTDKGRRLDVSGPITVTAGERMALRVTVTQRSTGAVAEGEGFLIGIVNPQQWEVRAHSVGKAVFEPGPATAVALGVTTARGAAATDAHQWLVEITLVRE